MRKKNKVAKNTNSCTIILKKKKLAGVFEQTREALISADIPLYKLNNIDIRNLFRNYSNEIIPYQTTLRKRCLDKIYDSVLNRIENFLKNKLLWPSIDETSVIEGRYVVNVIVGILSKDEEISKYKFLLNISELENCPSI